MQAFVQLATKDGAKLVRKQRSDRRPDDNLESYFSPAQEIEVTCTTEEREDFEQWHGIALDADVIGASEFRKLVEFLTSDYRLKTI